jgi:hypothetical protein
LGVHQRQITWQQRRDRILRCRQIAPKLNASGISNECKIADIDRLSAMRDEGLHIRAQFGDVAPFRHSIDKVTYARGFRWTARPLLESKAIEGKTTEPHFRRAVVWLVGSRLAGTMLAQLLLIPAAMLIVSVAEIV